MNRNLVLAVVFTLLFTANARGKSPLIESWLDHAILGERQSLEEVKAFVEARVAPVPQVTNVSDWESQAVDLRQQVLEKIVFRGEANNWRTAETKVEWSETIAGGPEYEIKKLRFEALPGMWIPALLYEPKQLTGKVPVVMNVNGHEREDGKAATYKQIRCINQAKRGMIALNVEWLGMGQLNTDGFNHYKMNQLDLCGTSGLAPFYLSISRGLDVLLAHPHADSTRVAVAGLSGGGWQTIFISSLDTRVTLANPVAGYSSFLTRAEHPKDLGDSEQTPCDLATVADYTQLTMLLAPRPALLTFNAKDNCCFESSYALPPLLAAARPIYQLYGQEANLSDHTNEQPGDHNFGVDNRQALYRMFARHFSTDPNMPLPTQELSCEGELKTKQELSVELPDGNADFHSLALGMISRLEQPIELTEQGELHQARQIRRQRLIELVKAQPDCSLSAHEAGSDSAENEQVKYWRLRIADQWTVPAVEISRGEPNATSIVIADAGRKSVAAQIDALLDQGVRVVAVDPFYFGESKIPVRDYLYALQVATVGQRPLGIQASQIGAIGRWLTRDRKFERVSVTAIGNRTSLIALIAAATEPNAITSLSLSDSLGSLKQVIERDGSVDKTPELFCFGLLKEFDIQQIAELILPRKVSFHDAGARVKQELNGLRQLYSQAGVDFDPLR